MYPRLPNDPSTGQPGQPAAMSYPYPVPGQPQYQPPPSYQPGFGYPYPNQPGQGQPGVYVQPINVQPMMPGQPAHPLPMAAAHPVQPGFPNITPTPTAPSAPTAPYSYGFGPLIEWVPTTPKTAASLSDRAVVAGYEGHDGSPLWVIRARFEGDLIPGKLAIKHQSAYVPWGGNENVVQNIEVCCARPEKVRWVQAQDGVIPPNAVPGGSTSSGETLYVGRAKHQGSLTPGKIHQSHKGMYISFGGKEVPYKVYEVLCSL